MSAVSEELRDGDGDCLHAGEVMFWARSVRETLADMAQGQSGPTRW